MRWNEQFKEFFNPPQGKLSLLLLVIFEKYVKSSVTGHGKVETKLSLIQLNSCCDWFQLVLILKNLYKKSITFAILVVLIRTNSFSAHFLAAPRLISLRHL
jgi:hypothetical protein